MEVDPKAFENVKSRLQHIFQLGAMKAEKIKNTCQVRWKDYLNQSYTSSEFCHEEIEFQTSPWEWGKKSLLQYFVFNYTKFIVFSWEICQHWGFYGHWSLFNMFIMGNCIYFCFFYKTEFIRIFVENWVYLPICVVHSSTAMNRLLRSVSQSVQSLSRVRLFVTPWIAARQAFLSITNSRSLLKLMSVESVMPSSHLILSSPFSSCPQSFPASGSVQMSQLIASGGPSIGVSASGSVLPVNTQDQSPCSPRDSQESSPTPQFKNISSLALSFLYSPTLTSIHDYWKNHSLD